MTTTQKLNVSEVTDIDNHNYACRRSQEITMVLHALEKLGGSKTREETTGWIAERGYYHISGDDLAAYSSEYRPRYRTLLAWARKDGVISDWIGGAGARDQWQITREGREVYERCLRKFRSGQWDVGRCYKWTLRFKRVIVPGWKGVELPDRGGDQCLQGYERWVAKFNSRKPCPAVI